MSWHRAVHPCDGGIGAQKGKDGAGEEAGAEKELETRGWRGLFEDMDILQAT